MDWVLSKPLVKERFALPRSSKPPHGRIEIQTQVDLKSAATKDKGPAWTLGEEVTPLTAVGLVSGCWWPPTLPPSEHAHSACACLFCLAF